MRKRQGWFSWVVLTLALAISAISAQAQLTNLTILKSFVDLTNDGWYPQAQPVLIDSTLYGATYSGGNFDNGAIFQISTNGTGFSLLYSFDGLINGANPSGSLVFNPFDSMLYGMTANGGTNGEGVIFSMDTFGISYTVLHTFAGGSDDGAFPNGSLTYDGSTTMFGMTTIGGTNNEGVLFSVDLTGSGFTVLHSFPSVPNDGAFPSEGVVFDGLNLLYGTAYFGGSNDAGIVFSVDTGGNSFTILHQCGDGSNDAFNPVGLLTLNGSTLYGISDFGGTNDAGTVFKVNTDGSGYTILHEFVGGTNDGAFPQFGSLVVTTNSLIFGATVNGGSDDAGIVYQMNLDGSEFTILHNFTTNENDGAYPLYGPIYTNGTLYGITDGGGPTNAGTTYSSGSISTNVITNLQIVDIKIVTNDVLITWTTTGIDPQVDRVQVTPGDALGGYTNNFKDLSPPINIPAGITTNQYTDKWGATNFPSRYYRVRVVP